MGEFIIKSLLETDAYKFSMAQCILHQFTDVNVKVKFRLRTEGVDLRPLKDRIEHELDVLCDLRFEPDEIEYLSKIRWLKPDFIDYLKRLYLFRDQIHVEEDPNENGGLSIWAEGPWRDVIWFEIPVLAIVSELYMSEHQFDSVEAHNRLTDSLLTFSQMRDIDTGYRLSDFGLRRRYSGAWHDRVVSVLSKNLGDTFSGTSNVYLAKKYGLKPIGTFAHELYMGVMGTDVRLSNVQRHTLQAWADEYRGDLGIALSDIFGFKAFLRDFDLYFAKLFDGCRHDSGDPMVWGEMLINHYKRLGIDPRTKVACWSDSLDAEKARDILRRFAGRIRCTFGIGTFLTNNTGIKPLNMVMKLVESNGQPVVKLSDSIGKAMCEDKSFVDYAKQQYDWSPISYDLSPIGKEAAR